MATVPGPSRTPLPVTASASPTAVRCEELPAAMATTSTPIARAGDCSSAGCWSSCTPSWMASRPPTLDGTITGDGDRVDRPGRHRGRTSHQERGEPGDREDDIGAQRGDDRGRTTAVVPVPALVAVVAEQVTGAVSRRGAGSVRARRGRRGGAAQAGRDRSWSRASAR